MTQIGITERGDAALSDDWVDWVYKKDKPAILITKNAPLLQKKHPDIFFKNVIIHVTCTGLGGTIIEPNVPSYKDILKWVVNKPATIQRKLVMRVDPICPTLFKLNQENFKGEDYFKGLSEILQTVDSLGLRCRISFLDMYEHVAERFSESGISKDESYCNYEYNGIHLPLEFRKAFLISLKSLAKNTEFEICGEPGLECHGCVSKTDLDILGIDDGPKDFGGQRLACKCLGVKKELLTNKTQCPHKCLYCYWK